MTEERNITDIKPSRRGFPVYSQNPSVRDVPLRQREKTYRIEKDNQLMLVNPSTGEIMGEGTAAFLKREVVDPERFMKVYFSALDHMFELTKTGQRVFKLVWKQVQDNRDNDKVELNPAIAKAAGLKVSDRIFQLGVRELLEKQFLFMSLSDGVYFINMKLLFNGSRVVVATEYILEGTQQNLPLPEPAPKQITGEAV
jgi:hypothetical protein